MNTKRLVVLGFALVAASAAALLARGMVGGGTPKVEAKIAPQVAMSQVLVANATLQPGQALTAEQVRWEKWPASSVDASFITHDAAPNIEDAVKGTVVRVPLQNGQPITNTEIVHASAAGFMAAMLNPGMRAISITITTDSGAGGFILPNDRIDLILTQKLPGDTPRVSVRTILENVRVLAVDQTFKQEKDTKTVIAKTATLELTPAQAEQVARAQNLGALSLSLRPLSEDPGAVASNAPAIAPAHGAAANTGNGLDDDAVQSTGADSVAIIRYGISQHSPKPDAGKPQ
jgi:pilus assembly protein CpaB